MTRFHRWIVDLFNALAAWYYRHKYGAAARQLGRDPHEGPDGQRGFIILEIDGLGYPYLRQALKQGYMPYLSRLLLTRKLRLARWRCGLPSTTPASQAGILFGNNWDIPGFRWYDKATGDSILCKFPGAARAIQERISSGRVGLLYGGSSYTNLFDGDARLALFTLSALGKDRLFENVRGFGFLILFALSPLRVIKVIGLAGWTWLVYVVKRLASWLKLRSQSSHFTFLGPLLEIANNVIFREVTTFCVLVDIYRGMPAIYAAYTGYDEIAHHFGVDSKEAFRTLRSLDKQIRQIDRMCQLYRRREYDLYILSDHGMTPSLPFRQVYRQTLQQFVAQHTGHGIATASEPKEVERVSERWIRFLLDEVQGLESRPRKIPSARMLQAARRELEEHLMVQTLETEWNLDRCRDIEVRNSGSLSHIYLNVTPRQMNLSEITILYPSLLEALVNHEGIGAVVGRQGDEVIIAGRSGALHLGPAGWRVMGGNPLAGLPDPDWAAEQVSRLAQFPHAGDLILLGAWDGDRVISFEEQVASHGGVGGAQNWSFLVFPAKERSLAQEIKNAEEIYARLVQIYRKRTEEVS